MITPEELFLEAMRNTGIDLAESPIADGIFHRFQGRQDKAGKKNGWYVLYGDDLPAGMFGHWSLLPDGQRWQSKPDNSLTPQERNQIKERIEHSRAARDKARDEIRAACRIKAEKMLGAAGDVKADHPYLIKKNITPQGARQLKDMLLIPVHKGKTLTGLQIITPDGVKKFLTGTEKAGAYLAIKGKGKTVYLVEGWATGCTIHELTRATVIVCFDCGNLEAVSKEIREKGPDYDMVMVADNDRLTTGNPGLTKAQAAALATAARLAIPTFPGDTGTDVNDLAEISGAAAVLACLEAAAIVDPISAPSPDTGTAIETTTGSNDDPLTAAVNRLAKLSPLEYDKVRKEQAKALGVRPATLDAEVKAARKEDISDDSPFEPVEPWTEPVDGAELLTALTATVRRFIICEPQTAQAVALWVAMTWFIDVVQVAPLAVITAPEKRCGKSMLLFLIGRLVSRPLTSSSITPSALFRSIDLWQPTLLIDEVDACLKDNEELRGLINCGHTRDSAFTIRCVGDDHTPTKFNVWGAKALSGIGHVADTLMDRAIILELRRKLSHESIDRIRYAEPGLFADLCSKLARFADDNCELVRMARPDLPASLNDRAQDNWEPLLAIATVAGGDWLKIGTAAALKLSGGESLSLSIGTELLADIYEIFEHKKVDRIGSADLIKELCADDEKPWSTYNRGFQIKPRQIASRLKGYGIHSKTIRLGFGDTPKGYERNQFVEAFSRYIATPPPVSATTPQIGIQTVIPVALNPQRCGYESEKETRKPAPIAACGVVADKITFLASEVIDLTGINFEVMT